MSRSKQARGQCSVYVYSGRSVSGYQCERKAVVTRKGSAYCRQHDPLEVEKRRVASARRYEAKFKAEQAARERGYESLRVQGEARALKALLSWMQNCRDSGTLTITPGEIEQWIKSRQK